MSRRTRSIAILLGVILIAFGIVNAARSATQRADNYTRARQIINSVFPPAARARAIIGIFPETFPGMRARSSIASLAR